MDLKEYTKIYDETAVFPEEVQNFGFAYILLGLFDELGEVEEKKDEGVKGKKLMYEYGDVLWYLNSFCRRLGYSFDEVVNSFNKDNNDMQAFDIFGIFKKYYRDGKDLNHAKIKQYIGGMYHFLEEEIKKDGFTVSECLKNNFNKLTDRKQRNKLKGDGDDR